jgi:hypothetical protein
MHGKEKHPRLYRQTRDLVGGLETAHHGHGNVHDNDIWGELLRHLHSLLTIGCFTTDVPFRFSFQDPADTLAHNLVIVGDQYLYSHSSLIAEKYEGAKSP